MTVDDVSRHALAQVEKEYGEGVLVRGSEVLAREPRLLPWGPAFNVLLSGPVESGSWVGVSGPEKSGKTVSALCLAARAQQQGSTVFYVKAEGRLSTKHLQGIAGLRLDGDRFFVLQSSAERLMTGQDFLRALTGLVLGTKNNFFIIDSVSGFLHEGEAVAGIGYEGRGSGAKLFNQFLRLTNQAVPVQGHVVVGITHLMSNTSGYGAAVVDKGSRDWRHQCDYQLRVKSKKNWVAGDRVIGLETRWMCLTSANGPPGGEIDSFIRFGVGVDRVYECLHFGCASGLVDRKGAWLHLGFVEGAPKFQGMERAYAALKANPAWADELERLLMGRGPCAPGGEA